MHFNSPISSEKADEFVRSLELRPDSRALDIGCGTGEFLLRVVAHHGVRGLGIDHDARCIAAAQTAATARGFQSRCEFRRGDANSFEAKPHTFDLALCIGSTHALGAGEAAYPNTIERLKCLVRPAGYVLIGECYWKQEPAADYLNLIGEPVGIYRDYAENISFAQARGLVLLHAATSSEDEWDDFESQHPSKIQSEAAANPNDPALAARMTHSRRWYDGYRRWGRSTMGFGLYLFRAPC